MSAVLDDEPCPACGGRHTLCLDDDRHLRARHYEYVCPAAGVAVRLPGDGWDRLAAGSPDGAVPVRPAGE